MKKTLLMLPVLALLIMPCGLFAQQETEANAQSAAMLAGNDTVQETTTTSEQERGKHHGKYDYDDDRKARGRTEANHYDDGE